MNFLEAAIGIFATTDRALAGIAVLYSVGVIVNSLELLTQRRQLWHEQGLLAWPVLGGGYIGRFPQWARRGLDSACSPWVLDGLLGLRILASLALPVTAIFQGSPVVPLAVLAFVQVALNWRLDRVQDGSDKMSGLIAFTLLAAALLPEDHLVQVAALAFLTAQVVFCYLVAGLAKAASAPWRTGQAFEEILGTVMYGVPALQPVFVRRPLLGWAAAWSVILWEVTFCVALFAPPGVTAVYLGAGVLFHAGVAGIMGFNSFLYMFVAAYPAVCYASAALRTGFFD
jgi:hypothetical protein